MRSETPDQEHIRELARLGEALVADLRAQRWDEVANVDSQVREQLDAIAAMENVSAELEQAKRQLKQLYERVIPAYEVACEKVRLMLVNHIDHAEARSAYQRISLLQGDE
jgi:hypothetical protein